MLQKLIRENHVKLRGAPCTAKSPVKAGDSIEIEFPVAKPMDLQPESLGLTVLLEDEHLLVINKAPGMVVHPGAGHSEHTLVNGLLHHCQGQLSGIGGVQRPGIVHRLDKDTSGCLIVAKTDPAHRRLVEMFQERNMEKTYLALVHGKPRMLSGRIEKSIERHPVHRNKMSVSEEGDGKAARTDWKILKTMDAASLLECRLHTGRTHQIRVHLASIGHPIVGDQVYGRSAKNPIFDSAKRQMLHAWRIRFEHPILKTSIFCEAPMPSDMSDFINFLSSA